MTFIDLMSKTSKQRKTAKSNEITMNCIDIISKWSKILLCRKTFETTENYNSDQIGRQNEQNVELRRKSFKTTQNYESDLNTMTCIDLMSKRSKQRKTTKVIKLRWICIDLTSKRSKMLSYHSKPLNYKSNQITWISSIWCSNDQNNAKQRKWSNYNELHRFDVKTI